jgi:hypothetical protein
MPQSQPRAKASGLTQLNYLTLYCLAKRLLSHVSSALNTDGSIVKVATRGVSRLRENPKSKSEEEP